MDNGKRSYFPTSGGFHIAYAVSVQVRGRSTGGTRPSLLKPA